jgi:hypothetical protein
VATSRWIPKAVNIKQVATGVVAGDWAQNDTVTITCDGVDFVITIGTLTSTAQVATTIKQAFEGETLTDTAASCVPPISDKGAKAIPQFREVTATVSGSTVIFTARTAGKPFTMSATESTVGSGTFTFTNAATSSSGKHDISIAKNLSAGSVLTDGDELVIDIGNVDIKYGLALGCQLAMLRKTKSFTGNIGLPETNVDENSFPYPEYRTKYLTTDDDSGTTVFNLEEGSGQGSGRVRIDAGAGQAVVNVYGKGTRAENSVPCILFIGSNAANELNNYAGDVGVAFYGDETAELSTVRHGDGATSEAQTYLGPGVDLSSATLYVNGGTITTNSEFDELNQIAGSHYHYAGDGETLNIDGGTFYEMASGSTYTTVSVGPKGTFNASKGVGPFTITDPVELHAGAKFLDPNGRGTYTAGFKLNRCTLADVTLVLGTDKTYTIT